MSAANGRSRSNALLGWQARLKLMSGRNDAERLVLPGIVWGFKESDDGLRCDILSVGWWRWGIGISVTRRIKPNAQHNWPPEAARRS